MAASVVYSYGTYLRLWLTRPALSDYEGASTYVRAHWQEGDLVDVSPFWATRAREYLGDLPFQGFRAPGNEDLTRYRRVWLLSLFGAEQREDLRQAMDLKGALAQERRFGRIDVRLYTVAGYEPVRYDFRDALARARVWVEHEDSRRDCVAAPDGRWRCSALEWNYVGPEILEIADEPRAVIWAHPVAGEDLVLEFEGVPLGRALTIGAGFSPIAVAYGGAPVALEVEADGRTLMRRFYPARPTLARDRIETPSLAGGVHRVRFKVTTMDDRVRHFCFTAEARG